MEKLITEIKEWIITKDNEANMLSTEYRMAKNEGYGKVAVQQIYVAYAEVIAQRTKLNKALAIIL